MKSPQRSRDAGGSGSNAPKEGPPRARRTLEALREVLAAAQARGVALDASYQHFDRSASGVVGVGDLLAALVELHLSSPATVWDERDAEDCLELLTRGKSRAYCSREDFARFFTAPIKAAGASPTAKRSATRKAAGSPLRSSLEQTEDARLRVTIDAGEGEVAPKSRKTTQVTLPEWAHARSKRALSELESMQRRRRPKRDAQLHLSSLASSSPGSFDSSLGDGDENNDAGMSSPGGSPSCGQVARLPLPPASPHKRDDALEFAPDAADRVFALDDAHAITYRILTHDLDKAADVALDDESARLRAVLLQVLATKDSPQQGSDLPGEPPAMLAPFRLTVFIDAFQQLETLAAFFEPLLVHFPRGKVLLCGHPTRSKRSTVWSSSFVADAYGRLLGSLSSQSREWLAQPKTGVGAVPQYLIGFGTGASAALQLLGMGVPLRSTTASPALQSFANALRALVLVNSVVEVDAAARGSLQSLCALLQRPASDAAPLHEACLSLLFSEHYLTQVAPSRRAALETFFRTRRAFFVGGSDCGASSHAELLRLLLRGALKSSDGRGAAANLAALPQPFAVLVVHGSQNALFLPGQVDALTRALSRRLDSMAESVAAALSNDKPSDGAVPFHVSWLKSGHEVAQERAAFLYDLLRQMILLAPRLDEATTASDEAACAPPVASAAQASEHVSLDGPTASSAARDMSRADGGSPRLESWRSSPTHDALVSVTERVRGHVAQHGLAWVQQELYDRGLEGAGATDAILARFEQVLAQEEADERRRLAQLARQQARHREGERQRLDKLQADAERQTRDAEAARSIARKEAERQRAFFAQMEAQRLAQARVREEQQRMALEDALALKHENRVFLEDERRARNDAVAKQVGEIEAERAEADRRGLQVQMQQERLAAQQAKREALKQFQRAFEQHELASSAVEAYCLDASPVREQFAALAEGARRIAADLARFYELKELQKLESAQRRAQLDALRDELAAKQTALRNAERVLTKATSTGMVAKAGLGTVRVVPVRPGELAALAKELDERRDACERGQHDVGLRAQELQWRDQLLQRLRVLIKRNEGFRLEMLPKLRACVDTGNDAVLLLREDDEQLLQRLADSRKLRERLETRARAVGAERERAERATTEFFDTRLRVEGASQRVQRALMVRELTREASQLEARIAELAADEPSIQRDLSANSSALNDAARSTLDVQCALDTLARVTHATANGTAGGGDRRPVAGVENPIDASADGGEDEAVDVSGRVRRKRHAQRSREERQWVAMDFALHPARYYKTVAAEEVELIARNADAAYACALGKEQLARLLTLPARNCLALAFLKTTEELEAHALLRKFSCGDGEEHFAQLDKHFAVDPHASARPVASTLEALASALEKQAESSRLTGGDKAREDRGAVPRDRRALLDEGATSASVTTLLSVASATIDPHQSVTHSFQLPAHRVGVLSLTVSVVFQGSFKPAGYQNGRLAAMLYVLPPSDGASSVRAPPMPVGKCFLARDIALCTPQSLGRLVIRHEPDVVPLCGAATYQVVLGAPVRTRYSVDVQARTALFAGEALQRKRSAALRTQELLPRKRDEAQNVFTTIQLSERKKRLARAMAAEAKAAGRAAELELLRATRELDADTAAPQLSRTQRLALHRRVHEAEARFSDCSFRSAKREEEARDIDQCLRELTRIHVDLLDECEQMERELADCRACLPRIAAALAAGEGGDDAGDVAGAREAAALNAAYEPIGARSAKLRWAELTAMKAKLPSMMTSAERLRRKYRKGRDALDKKEREWVVLDRILHPRVYDWEERLSMGSDGATNGSDAVASDWRMRLHGTHAALSKDEQQLAALSRLEVERIMKSPWNLLERKEIQVRKVVTRFRDDYGSPAAASSVASSTGPPSTLAALLRTRKWSDLTAEEREWRQYDRVLNPAYYRAAASSESATRVQQLAQSSAAAAADAAPPPPPAVAREDVIAALNTPEDEVFTLPSDVLRARTLLLKYDPQLSSNLLEAARVRLGQQTPAQVAETDVDARCRLVYDELQRAIANTRNERMDSSVLHSTPQRFPTKVLRLELEKELDRLLRSQITEREEHELRALFLDKKKTGRGRAQGAHAAHSNADESESVSESDSDEEAVVAREARDSRRLAQLGPKNANARGKAAKQQSVQRQRRRIRDALQPRSLEERRRLLEEQELGAGGCMACRTNPCSWRMYLADSTATVQARMEALHEELERVKHCADAVLRSSVCLAAVQSGRDAVVMRRADLFDELTAERKRWATHLRLQRVDAEFHATFQSRSPYFETRALHDFPQVQLTDKIQRALLREHNALVAQLAAAEMVEDALEAMLEGWVFGERESQRAAVGFVPSLKRDGPLSLQDLRRLEQEALSPPQDAAADAAHGREQQGEPYDKWVPIEVAALERQQGRKVVQQGSALDKSLTETENALRFGIFCMTLMYFRGLAMLKRQRATWSQSKTSTASAAADISAERRRMLQEQRNVARRQQKAAGFDAKAQRAAARAQKMHEEKAAAYRRRLVTEHRRATSEARAAVEIQRTYRGHLGRIAGKRWMVRRREIDAQRALDRAAAVTLQRAYRGRLGRLAAEERRIELAEFIAQLRAEEAIEEEEAYWRAHPVERAARSVAAFVTKQA